jgi:hypothetical protein
MRNVETLLVKEVENMMIMMKRMKNGAGRRE